MFTSVINDLYFVYNDPKKNPTIYIGNSPDPVYINELANALNECQPILIRITLKNFFSVEQLDEIISDLEEQKIGGN